MLPLCWFQSLISCSKTCKVSCRLFPQPALSPSIYIPQFLHPHKIRGFFVFKIWTKRGVIKNCSEIGGLVKSGVFLRDGGCQIVLSVFLRKSMFSLLLEFFFFCFCLVNIHACCNQQIYSFRWFTFYQKIIYYEISFCITLIFK